MSIVPRRCCSAMRCKNIKIINKFCLTKYKTNFAHTAEKRQKLVQVNTNIGKKLNFNLISLVITLVRCWSFVYRN